ncbi:50S ribosomal protein L17 [Marinoscillum sp.]|uniref:50S ribosomal protein L17 n=1 Tax=Marinoscillum sp. TaxID=2024838 RepID=UPI003BAA0F99
MRHGKKFNHLGRTASHRKAMLSNMASSLILHKRINTTVAKAKALRKYVEPLITKAKTDTTHSRRIAFSYLQDKVSVQELFGPIAEKISSRPGGYTRIIKTGIRLGDNAEMCMIELVDFNELLLQDSDAAKAKTRRSRRGGKKAESTTATAVEDAVVVEEPAAEAEVTEEPAAEAAPEEPTSEASDDTEEKEKSE